MSLPGADELFRTTGGMALQSSSPRKQGNPNTPNNAQNTSNANGEPRVPAQGEPDEAGAESASASASSSEEHSAADADPSEEGRSRATDAAAAAGRAMTPQARRPQEGGTAGPVAGAAPRRRGRGANRRPSGRERHDEKITVYVSAEELMDLEHARLVLRGEHGLAVDRGRIVREAVAVVLADLEQRGDASILVRRLRGR
ncbi:hypothetical protein GLX30_27720 [Streptomyces sp. Tu 2975]|uniref:hypothetical protein n=1 Tax=Streptomyces sp. Tu 2975 TaxID=2676871 RepID=UPI00135C67B3|nr:hypothetical protein [Streptomyces sp. Tu 2975]QIP88784.1 hypothetical protein GLX30_27720 [Streptomyces sp. Tu 2975]